MPNWKKVLTSGSAGELSSLYAPSITGSLQGTASFAISASYAATASYSLATTENRILVLNQSGYTISKGIVVHITASGTASDIPRIISASYTSDAASANTLGIASETITNGSQGYVTTEGVLVGIDTSAFTSGQLVFLGEAGSITGSAPQAPLHSVRLGQIIREQSVNGSIYVRIDNGYELGELHDVTDTTTTASYGDLFIKSGSVWINSRQLTGSYGLTGSLSATSFSGSLFGTASWSTNAVTASFITTAQTASYVLNAVSASFVSTASFVTTLNQNVVITGSAAIATSTIGPSENTLTLGARDSINEGGQLGFNAPGGTYTSASMIDVYQNQIRILRGTNAGSDALVTQWNLHTKQMQLPAYTNASSFTGTATANLAVDSAGNIITVSTSGGTVFPYVGNAVITGSLTVTQPIYVPINGAMYFQGGDDAALYDVNIVNTMGIYGVQDVTVGAVKLGSNGPVLYGSGSKLGIGTTNPSSASLMVNGNVWATSFTGSLFGTSSWATNAVTSSYIVTAQTASYVLNAVSSSFATTASYVLNAVSSSFATNALTASYVANASSFPYTGSAIITGSLILTGSMVVSQNITGSRMLLSSSNGTSNGSTLTVYGSGSAQPVFTIQGSQGELFSVTDSLSGSLFSVNDISGLPILEVFSDNRVLIGDFQAPALFTTKKVTTAATNFTVYNGIPTASYDGAWFEYMARSGSNARAGSIMAIWSGSSINYTETTTTDFGTTADLAFRVIMSGSNMALTGSSTNTGWSIKTIIRSI